jgi:hypothetical protein
MERGCECDKSIQLKNEGTIKATLYADDQVHITASESKLHID